MIRWRAAVAMACLLLASAGAAAQQTWLGTYPATIAAEFRGQIGRRLTFLCPATAPQSAKVWGTDSYTDDSWICPAAVHAGALQPDKPGVVTIVMGGGAESFQGSQRNGITSQGFGPWASSYKFSQTGEPGQIDWKTAYQYMPIQYPDPVIVVCPPAGSLEWRIWGTDIYTYDSSICVAGVHAGLISPAAGGKLAVTMHSLGLDSYQASTRNGVSSLSWMPGAARDYPYSFGVTRAAIAASLPSTRNPEAGVELKDVNLSRTIELPGIASVGASTTVASNTFDLPGITAVGTFTTLPPRIIDLSGISATGTFEAAAPRIVDVRGITAVGTFKPVASRIIDLPGITATGTFATAASRTIALNGFAGSGEPAKAASRTISVAGFTGSGVPVTAASLSIALAGWTGSGQ